jgi:photosystem II stability/assembly factor-like uncharacterized protein
MLLGFLIPLCLAGPAAAKNEDLLSICFVSHDRGWACGRWGKVLMTLDGGQTWASGQTKVDYTLAGIHFADDQIGVAVGDEGTIIRTQDGGATWERVKSPVNYFLMDVFFTSPEIGFIVTERTTILKTEDSGKTWNIVFQDEDYILKSISFCDAQNGWAVGEYGFIYRTFDGGDTWNHQAGFFDISDETGDIEGESYLFDVRAVNPMTAWAVGIDGMVKRTRDGGNSWQIIPTNVPKTPFFSIALGPEKSIVIVGDGVVLRSKNGGRLWDGVPMEPPFPYGWLYNVTARPAKNGVGPAGLSNQFVACGQGGTLYTGDPGSWQQILPIPQKPALIAEKN